jgi:hypothetical protein
MKIATWLCALFLLPCVCRVAPLLAENGILTNEGVAGDMDKNRRSPLLSVSTTIGQNSVRILADAAIQHEYTQRYPIQFDFFINRTLYTSQYRSPELPGPIGVHIPASVAQPPFNYVVVAKVMAPNRTFTSSIQGAVFPLDLASTFASCIATKDGTEYKAENVKAVQGTSTTFSLEFEETDEETDKTTKVEFGGEITQSNLEGTIKLSLPDKDPLLVKLSGTATIENNKLVSFTSISSDQSIGLDCEQEPL